jgi:uncharacterized membrane protein YqhA
MLKYKIAIVLSMIQSVLLLYLGLEMSEPNSFQEHFCLIYSVFFIVCAATFAYIIKEES